MWLDAARTTTTTANSKFSFALYAQIESMNKRSCFELNLTHSSLKNNEWLHSPSLTLLPPVFYTQTIIYSCCFTEPYFLITATDVQMYWYKYIYIYIISNIVFNTQLLQLIIITMNLNIRSVQLQLKMAISLTKKGRRLLSSIFEL